ncbi:MAG TPA: sensor histidine kinase [Lacunisphaera sp.]|nr:sensor histidine kinase [Lacunisphaera sp.]
MTLFDRWPRFSQALVYLTLPVLFSLAGGVETVLKAGRPEWPLAVWREAVYCAAWVVLIPPIFWLCRWLHAGPRRWPRYLLGLGAGTGLTIVLLPLTYQIIRIGLWSIAWKLSWVEATPPAFWADYRVLFPYMLTAAVVIFASTVIAWYAVTNHREAEKRLLESVELGAMLQKAQLQALRSQLNPHFLFNTLHSIAELIHENPQRAEQMLLQLGELLHKSLKTQAIQVPLREELDFIRRYLAIEQMRLGDRLELVWNIEPAVEEALVPSLILQPIVENAIRHGIAASPRGGRLEITAARATGHLRLEVRDNGPGLGASGEKPGNGIGIENTRARLERFYGPRASFRLTSDQGVVVSMALPWPG